VPDFEGAAGIPSHDDKPLHAWERFARATPDGVPESLAEIVQETESLLSARAATAGVPADLSPG
jgi:hypothetical protein